MNDTIYTHLEEYVNKHIGESALVFCGGKTTIDFRFSGIFDDSKIIGMNYLIFLKLLKYRRMDYYFVQDYGWAESILSHGTHREFMYNYNANYCKIQSFYGIRSWNDQFPLPKKSLFFEFLMAPVITKRGSLVEDFSLMRNFTFSSDISKEPIYSNSTILFSVMQFLLSMGFVKIYLVGADSSDNGKWFNPNRKKMGWNSNFPAGNFQIKERFEYFKEWKDNTYPEVDIISINPIGLKGMFEDLYL